MKIALVPPFIILLSTVILIRKTIFCYFDEIPAHPRVIFVGGEMIIKICMLAVYWFS